MNGRIIKSSSVYRIATFVVGFQGTRFQSVAAVFVCLLLLIGDNLGWIGKTQHVQTETLGRCNSPKLNRFVARYVSSENCLCGQISRKYCWSRTVLLAMSA